MVVRQLHAKQRTETGPEAGKRQACVWCFTENRDALAFLRVGPASNAILFHGGRQRNQCAHLAPLHSNAEAMGGIAERMNVPLHAVEVRLNG